MSVIFQSKRLLVKEYATGKGTDMGYVIDVVGEGSLYCDTAIIDTWLERLEALATSDHLQDNVPDLDEELYRYAKSYLSKGGHSVGGVSKVGRSLFSK